MTIWQCLDSILPAKGSEICHLDETQLSLHKSRWWKDFHAKKWGDEKTHGWSVFTRRTHFFKSQIQWLLYLIWSNVNADFFTLRFSKIIHDLFVVLHVPVCVHKTQSWKVPSVWVYVLEWIILMLSLYYLNNYSSISVYYNTLTY